MDRQGWRDFFITVFLLGISFVIALLSSIAAEQNAVKMAAVAAGISLLLAVTCAFYIVPRLARKVRLDFLGFSIRTTVTVEGLVFVVVLVVIAFAAWNTGNNLLYLILSAMLAFLVTANLISRMSLSDISIQLRFPDHIFAGDPANLTVTLINGKRLIPAFSLLVEPLSEPGVREAEERGHERTANRAGNARGRPSQERAAHEIGEHRVGHTNGPSSVPDVLGKLAHFTLVPPRATARQRIEHKFERRGKYPITAFKVSTKFPTGFLKKWRKIAATGEIVVYPKPRPLDDFYHGLPMLAGQVSSHLRGFGDDLYGIRRYHPSDHIRNIDWKATAKSSELMVRDRIREDERRLTIFFDVSRPVSFGGGSAQPESEPRSPEMAQVVFEAKFEAAILMAASLANHFIREGAEVELVTQREDECIDSGKGLDHLYIILRQLAGLRPHNPEQTAQGGGAKGPRRRLWSRRARVASVAQGAPEQPGTARANASAPWRSIEDIPLLEDERRFKVLITPAAKGSIPASIWRSAHVVFMEDL